MDVSGVSDLSFVTTVSMDKSDYPGLGNIGGIEGAFKVVGADPHKFVIERANGGSRLAPKYLECFVGNFFICLHDTQSDV